MKTLSTLFLFSTILFAQYTSNDYELLKTTFLREFDSGIIIQYLESGNEQKINAALLSLAQSEDTSFVKLIRKLDFKIYGKQIAFALGEIGPSAESVNYLLDKLRSNPGNSEDIYEAIGKIGNESDLLETIEIYNENKSEGFPLAIYNFHIRSIIDSSGNDVKILLKNLKLTDNNTKLFRSLFTLYRVAPEKVKLQDLELILKGNFDPSIKTYALGILRKSKTFPFPFSLAEELMNSNEWSVRCEAARTICYYNFQNEEELNSYLQLLSDPIGNNPNVSITAAQSLRNVVLADSSLIKTIKKTINNLLQKEIHPNTRSEIVLYLRYQNSSKENEIYNKYQKLLSPNYRYRYLSSISDPRLAFNKLKNEFENASSYDKFFIFSSIGVFYDSLKYSKDYSDFILDQFSSQEPMVITLASYTIDSSFAAKHSEELKTRLTTMFNEQVDNSDFNPALTSVFTFTDYIDTNFSKELISKVSGSENYDLRYELRDDIELTEKVNDYRSILFSRLFSKAFDYPKAKVKTSKGTFTIQFAPQIAPISVGNFIYLAEQGYYNNIVFHRVVPNFVIQTGDATGSGWSGPSHTIVSEFSPQPFDTYYVGMASAGKDTEGSQWFVMQNYYPHLNGNYTNFGKVIDGFNTVNEIDQYDVVEEVQLIK